MTRKKKTFNSNENSLISNFVDMPSISGKKKGTEPRKEKQNLIILNETKTSSGLTQQMQNLTIDDFDLRFRVSAHTTLFYADKKGNLYKVVVLDHQSNKTQIRYVDWGPNFDEWVCCRSIWAYSQFTSQLSTSKTIPHDIAARIDELVSATNSEEMAEINTSQNTANFNLNALPDLETICKEKIPTLRLIPVKFRLRWSELLTPIIEGCVSQPNSPENWKRVFAISKCVLRASNRGGINTNSSRNGSC